MVERPAVRGVGGSGVEANCEVRFYGVSPAEGWRKRPGKVLRRTKGGCQGLADRQGPRRYDGRDSSSGSRAAGAARRPEETFHQDRECCAP